LKALLENRFAPLTLHMGFVEVSFDLTVRTYLEWHHQLAERFGDKIKTEYLQASLPEALIKLQPLTTPRSRVLFIETKSSWTAYFDNGLRGSDPESISHLSRLIPCRSLAVHCSPDRSRIEHRGMLRVYGGVIFRLYTDHETDWLNLERTIVAMNDGGNDGSKWIFTAEGRVQPFEELEKYKARRIRDRFTDEMLERYCAALGIRAFDEDFYGTKTFVAELPNQLAPGSPMMSLDEARRHTFPSGNSLSA